MALRLLEIVLPAEEEESAQGLLQEFGITSFWQERSSERHILIKLLLSAGKTEAILDALEKSFSSRKDFRIVLLPVEASIPRQEAEPGTTPEEESLKAEEDLETQADRISREELYHDIQDVTRFSKVYVSMVVLSSVVAAIGILRNNVAIIIGAMVIAPLLGPNVALSLATTLGDSSLGRMALKTSIVGVLIALMISGSLGALITFDATIPEIVSRTTVSLGDIVLALASGTAGALAFTTGLPSALIGVMVAVALLPPLVTCGLLLGAGNAVMAMRASLLFLTNLICINLAGVATFLAQGIRPLSWWEAARARRATRRAGLLWVLLLLALAVVIVISQKR